jgi:UDP-N-acetylmuramate dehydrogenase
VADCGFAGLVLRVDIRGISQAKVDGNTLFTAAAGEDWDSFVAHTVSCGCAGLECLSGIPGTVGAAPVQNVGAYGQEVGRSIARVHLLDVQTGVLDVFDRDRCAFGYRASIFNASDRGRYIILKVEFLLEPRGPATVAYADLQKHFAGRTPSLQETRDAVCEIRRRKGMQLVEGDEDCRSAGSFFKNPVLSEERFTELARRLSARGLSIPSYPELNSQHKIPAGWLVEQAGFARGHTLGRVGISRKHALAIINRGGATAGEVVALKNAIQSAVREQFGIELHPEPVFLGFEGPEL